MKRFFFTVMAGAILSSAYSYPVTVRSLGKVVGSGVFSLTRDGSKVIKVLDFKTTENGVTKTVDDRTVYLSDGTPSEDNVAIYSGKQSLRLITDITSKGATVKGTIDGKKVSRFVPIPKGITPANLSNVWWVLTKPKLNQMVIAVNFDSETLKWIPSTITYRGDSSVSVGGHQVIGHRIYVTGGAADQEIWLDSDGNLLRFGSGDLAIVKA